MTDRTIWESYVQFSTGVIRIGSRLNRPDFSGIECDDLDSEGFHEFSLAGRLEGMPRTTDRGQGSRPQSVHTIISMKFVVANPNGRVRKAPQQPCSYCDQGQGGRNLWCPVTFCLTDAEDHAQTNKADKDGRCHDERDQLTPPT